MRTPLLGLIMLLPACSSHKEWNASQVVSRSKPFNSAQLQYTSDNELQGVGVELLKGAFGTLGYLNVSARQIPTLPEAPEMSIVVLVIEGEKFPYHANRMEGGQKLLLPSEATEKLISTLESNQAVSIHLDGFMTKLEPSASRFWNIFKRFNAKGDGKLLSPDIQVDDRA